MTDLLEQIMLQAGLSPLPAPTPPSLALSIEEQPAQFHQFRYKDVNDSRLGGILKGRLAGPQVESFTRLRVTGIGERVRAVCVRGCTLTPDLRPHPFLLHGDDCADGWMNCCRQVAKRHLESGQMDISLERLSIISVQSNKVEEELAARQQRRFNPDPSLAQMQQPQQQQQKRSWGELCLYFQLFYTLDTGEEITGNYVITDVIKNKKANFNIDRVFPHDVSLSGGQNVYIYFSKALTDLNADSYEVIICAHGVQDPDRELRIRPTEVKPNLIELRTPQEQQLRRKLASDSSHERVSTNLRVVCRATGQHSKETQLMFTDTCATCGQRIRPDAGDLRHHQPPPTKTQRLDRAGFINMLPAGISGALESVENDIFSVPGAAHNIVTDALPEFDEDFLNTIEELGT